MSESQIRERVEAWGEALRRKDLERVMSLYAAPVVSFDLNPPLRSRARRRSS